MWKCTTCGESLEHQFDTCWNCGAQRPENIQISDISPHDEKPTTARNRQARDKKTKRCPFCGEEILAVAIKCKHCASNLPGSQESSINSLTAPNGKSKLAAALFALFLGGFGIHKFYLGRVGWGITYLLFCWTFIPALIGFIEGILLLVMSDSDFNAKFGAA